MQRSKCFHVATVFVPSFTATTRKGDYHEATAGEKDQVSVMLRVQVANKLHDGRTRARRAAIFVYQSDTVADEGLLTLASQCFAVTYIAYLIYVSTCCFLITMADQGSIGVTIDINFNDAARVNY